jgi:NAD(P)-dependent dehydrogenase (short-subunit alcohol dehydrogenase family)
MPLAHRTFLTLGATGGIGRGIHDRLRKEGAVALASGREATKLAATEPDPARRVLLDLANPASWDGPVNTLPELDGLVVCSGKLDVLPLQAASPAAFAEVIDINLVAPALLIRHLLRARRLRDGAALVLISSIASQGSAGHAAYGASKAGLNGLMRTLAAELAPRKIRVNCVSPGLVNTGMYDQVKAMMSPEELAAYEKTYPLGVCTAAGIAGPVAFLLGDDAREITGQDLVVDGGVGLG